jgi:hypothetical protein
MEIAWLLSMITVAVVHPVASSQPLLILDEGRVLATGVSAPSINELPPRLASHLLGGIQMPASCSFAEGSSQRSVVW